jgi:hypothetical protein
MIEIKNEEGRLELYVFRKYEGCHTQGGEKDEKE